MSVLKKFDRNYWLYWVASAVSMAASNILQYILSLYVLELTGSATLFASMLSIIIIPRLFLTPLAGVLADRMRKIRLMSWMVLGEAVVLGIYALLSGCFSMGIGWIYLLVVILEIGEIFYDGSAAAILPELVPQDAIKDAISVSKVDDGIVVVTAPMMAALLYSAATLPLAFGVVAILNFSAFMIQRCIHPKYEVSGNRSSNEKPSVWKGFTQGMRYIRNDGYLRGFVAVLPIANTFFSATFSVSVMYLFRESYQLSAYAYGLYCSVTSSMSLIVPLLAVPIVSKFPAHRIYAVSTSLIAAEIFGIGCAAFLGVNGYIPIMVSVAVITVLDCMTIAEAIPMQMASSAILQTTVPAELLGRTSSTVRMVSIASVALGNMLFGTLNDLTVVWLPIFLGGAGVACASMVYRAILKKSYNNSEQSQNYSNT